MAEPTPDELPEPKRATDKGDVPDPEFLPKQKVGDECENCRDFCKRNNLPVNILQRLPGSTMNHKMIVPACPRCDSPEIFKMDNKEPA